MASWTAPGSPRSTSRSGQPTATRSSTSSSGVRPEPRRRRGSRLADGRRIGQPGASPDESGYYHFADYLWLRAYLTDAFYLQAMSGLATFGNRTGLTYDPRQATASDGSHHSVALGYQYASAQVMLAYHWNFEKVDEVPNDFLRLMVTYAF